MKRIGVIWICIVLMFSTAFLIIEVSEDIEGKVIIQDGVNYRPHVPIRINGNGDFAAIATSGDGSRGNPWIIEGWDINGTGYGFCIYVGNTTEYFEVRDCNLHEANGNPDYWNTGLVLTNVQNGMITNNSVSSNDHCGIALEWSSNNIIKNNIASSNNNIGILLKSSSNNIIMNNTASENSLGILITSSSNNNIIMNNTVSSNNDRGIIIENSSNNNITNNIVSSNIDYGIVLYSSSNNNITNNTASNNNRGIYLFRSDGNTLTNNTVSSNFADGIHLYFSSYNTLTNNTASNNKSSYKIVGIRIINSNNIILTNNKMSDDGIYLWGDQLNYWNTHTIDTSNTMNGKPIYYWKNQMSGTVPPGAGQVILANCLNIVIENQNINGGAFGLTLGYSDGNTLTNNTASNNWASIDIYRSSNNTLKNNTASNSDVGIHLLYSNYNTITNNTVSSNSWLGIYIHYSNNNTVFHNNFINNTGYYGSNANSWDNGYPSGGNYWSDYNGSDIFSGPGQNISGSDGIGDTPYTFDREQDNYPLMDPLTPPVDFATSTGPQGAGHDPIITITYDWTGTPAAVDLFYSNDTGDSWNYLGTDTTVDGSYDWGPASNPAPKPSKYYWIANIQNGADDVGIPPNGTEPEAGPYNWKTYDLTINDMQPLSNPPGNWEFVSIPLDVNDDLLTVFDDANWGDGGTTWDYIQWYDANNPSNPWKSYSIYRPAALNDNVVVDNTMGFWIHLTGNDGDGVLTAGSGTEPVTTSIQLYAGWNLIGYPTMTEMIVANALWGTGADKVEVFDPAEPYRIREVGPTYLMKPGEGYWVHVPADTVWVVDW